MTSSANFLAILSRIACRSAVSPSSQYLDLWIHPIAVVLSPIIKMQSPFRILPLIMSSTGVPHKRETRAHLCAHDRLDRMEWRNHRIHLSDSNPQVHGCRHLRNSRCLGGERRLYSCSHLCELVVIFSNKCPSLTA